MTTIAGIEIQSLRGRRGFVIVQSRLVLASAVVGEAKYPLKQAQEVREFASTDKEIAKIEGRLHSLLKDLPVQDIPTVEGILDDVFTKSNLDFRFPVALSLVNALAEERGTDASLLLGGEFVNTVPLPIVRVSRLEGDLDAPLFLLATEPLDDSWFLASPLPPTVAFTLDQPDALARALEPALLRHGVVVDLRECALESAALKVLMQVSERLLLLIDPEQLTALGKLSPPNLSEILERTFLYLSLDELPLYREVVEPVLPVRRLVVTIPASHSITQVVADIQALDDDGFHLALDSRADTYTRLGLFSMARGLRFRHLWIEDSLDASLGVLNRVAMLGRKNRKVVYRPSVPAEEAE